MVLPRSIINKPIMTRALLSLAIASSLLVVAMIMSVSLNHLRLLPALNL